MIFSVVEALVVVIIVQIKRLAVDITMLSAETLMVANAVVTIDVRVRGEVASIVVTAAIAIFELIVGTISIAVVVGINKAIAVAVVVVIVVMMAMTGRRR